MEQNRKTVIVIQTQVNRPVETVWKYWTKPQDIIKWNNASDDWHTTKSENDLIEGGRFSYRMEAKDGSQGFDFGGVYSKVIVNKQIDYILDDGRRVSVSFSFANKKTSIVETFEAENVHPVETQRGGWQAILNNFKKYVESK